MNVFPSLQTVASAKNQNISHQQCTGGLLYMYTLRMSGWISNTPLIHSLFELQWWPSFDKSKWVYPQEPLYAMMIESFLEINKKHNIYCNYICKIERTWIHQHLHAWTTLPNERIVMAAVIHSWVGLRAQKLIPDMSLNAHDPKHRKWSRHALGCSRDLKNQAYYLIRAL